MYTTNEAIFRNISRDMSSGLLLLDFQGCVSFVNPAAVAILGKTEEQLRQQSLVQYLFGFDNNDAFIQLILDAVYDKSKTQEGIVSFRNAQGSMMLRVKTSYLYNGDERIGIICMMDDMTELTELQDAVRAMNEIKALNKSLTLRNRLLYETFGRFLSDDIVKQLLDTEDGLALGGKKRCVTIMMSDLRGFTALSEQMTALELIRMLNHYLGEMTRIIQKHKGTIIEFIGDGIMAIFGAPVDIDHQADCAAAAAVEMQAAMPEINAWNRQNGCPELEMGIGLHTGDVIIGNIGSEKRTKYGAVGLNVSLCGRIESYTTGGQILISSDTRSRISQPLDIEAEQDITPKGSLTSIHLYRITGIGSLSCKEDKEAPLTPLSIPQPVSFMGFQEKTTIEQTLHGTVTALSDTHLLLSSPTPLSVYDNLVIEADGKLYAKVIAAENAQYKLCFTSRPPSFQSWKSKMLQN